MKQILLSLFRYRQVNFLNVIGLSAAYIAFIVLVIQVRYEYGFDRFHRNADRIFRVDNLNLDDGSTFVLHSPQSVRNIINTYPEIEKGALYYSTIQLSHITVEKGKTEEGFRERIYAASPDIIDVFDYTIIEGDRNALEIPDQAIIPESLAKRMFGNISAINQIIYAKEEIWITDQKEFTIGAVYKDYPKNSQLDNVIIASLSETRLRQIGNGGNFFFYALLDNKESANKITQQYNSKLNQENENEMGISFISLPDIYYESKTTRSKSGNRQMTHFLSLISFLVILIASINFVNFSTSTATMRLRNINIRKVLGCSINRLRRHLLWESLIICMFSYLIAIGSVWLMGKTNILSFIDADVSVNNNIPVLLFAFLIISILGIIAGLYPAYYLTSFQTALVLKGSFGLSLSGRKLRTILISVQYIISIMLIVASIVILLQQNYIRNYNLGFDRDHIAVVQLNGKVLNNKDEYVNKLKEFSGIEDVAFAKWRMGAHDAYTTYFIEHRDKSVSFYTFEVSPNFLNVMNIPIIEGSNFPQDNESQMIFIFNKRLKEELQADIGEELNWMQGPQKGRLVGVTGDIKATSLRHEEDKITFMIYPGITLPISYIRLASGSNPKAAVKHIQSVLKNIDDSFPFVIEFYDEFYQTLYQKELKLNKIMTSFTLLAIIISIMGVFGLVLFETQYRRKEIGIRKINGATIVDIFILFIKTYLRIVCICFIIAAPIAYFMVTKWLETFVYRTPVYWWVFFIAFLIVSFITFLTVIIQNWRTANENPINSIRKE